MPPTLDCPLEALSPADAVRLAREAYGLTADARPLPGEYDDNFELETSDRGAFVLKVMHPARARPLVDLQCQALLEAVLGEDGARPRSQKPALGRE